MTYVLDERMKELVENAKKEKALKDVAVDTAKEKAKAAEVAEKKVKATEKAQLVVEKKLAEVEEKIGGIELKLAQAESLTSPKLMKSPTLRRLFMLPRKGGKTKASQMLRLCEAYCSPSPDSWVW